MTAHLDKTATRTGRALLAALAQGGPACAGVLAGPDGTPTGVWLRGDARPARAAVLALDEARDHPRLPFDPADPHLTAVVGRPRWWTLAEHPDGTWDATPAPDGSATTGAALGVVVTFEASPVP